MSLPETIMMAAFLLVWLGLILGWTRELLGGSLIVGGMAAFYLLDYLFSGTFPRGPFFLFIALTGLVFQICGSHNKSSDINQGPRREDKYSRIRIAHSPLTH
jgi:multisubunit Na+/H+ antiporter MnhE subunit